MARNNVLELAQIVQKSFQRITRANGESFYCIKDDAPDWIQDMCREAHNGMLPEDTRYAFILEALEAIVDADGDLDSVDLEADTYTSDLTAWLASRNDRYQYIDDAAGEYFDDGATTIERLQGGQLKEKREVLDLVVSFLTECDAETESA